MKQAMAQLMGGPKSATSQVQPPAVPVDVADNIDLDLPPPPPMPSLEPADTST